MVADTKEQVVVITGGSGGVGTILRTQLARPGRTLRLFDKREPSEPAGPGEEFVLGDVTDEDALAGAVTGADALIHLGGLPREGAWNDILRINIDGTHSALQEAARAGIKKVVLASSNHAVGFRRLADAGAVHGLDDGLPADSTPRPDTYYGVSKATMEALGSLFHSRFGMDVTAIRIGSSFVDPLPLGRRGLMTWMSPGDTGRLFEACLADREPGYRIVWGSSANTQRKYSLAEAAELGYEPQDDAEVYAKKMDQQGAAALSDADATFVGGGFTTTELGEFNPL